MSVVASSLKRVLVGLSLQTLLVLAIAPARAADISSSPPIPTGRARVWFLRVLDPGLSFDTATIYVNGVAIGESRPGTVFSVDLAPGTYTFALPNNVSDGSQPTVQLTGGAQIYFNVNSNNWIGVSEAEQDHGRYILEIRELAAPLAVKYFPALTMLPPSGAASGRDSLDPPNH
jgi:hypothetical protein